MAILNPPISLMWKLETDFGLLYLKPSSVSQLDSVLSGGCHLLQQSFGYTNRPSRLPLLTWLPTFCPTIMDPFLYHAYLPWISWEISFTCPRPSRLIYITSMSDGQPSGDYGNSDRQTNKTMVRSYRIDQTIQKEEKGREGKGVGWTKCGSTRLGMHTYSGNNQTKWIQMVV